jgi:hypothetical protein
LRAGSDQELFQGEGRTMSRSWLKQVADVFRPQSRRRRQAARARERLARPRLEELEDRTLLSIAVENFAGYDPGTLSGQNLGSGWGGSWGDAGSNSSARVVNAGLGTVSLFASAGPSVQYVFGPSARRLDSSRILPEPVTLQPAAYVAALVNMGTAGGTGGSSGGIGLYSGPAQRFLIGEPQGAKQWGIASAGGATALGPVPITDSTTVLLVARIDQINHVLTLWVNPDLTNTEAANIPAATLNYTGPDDFDTVRLLGSSPAGDSWNFDNLRVNTDGSPFAQPSGQTDWVGQGPQITTGGQVLGMTTNGQLAQVAGAIRAVAVSPTDSNTVFVGTANGGVWRTDNINATRTVEPTDLTRAAAPAVTDVTLAPLGGPPGSQFLTADGTYSYKITQVDSGGTESNISDPFPRRESNSPQGRTRSCCKTCQPARRGPRPGFTARSPAATVTASWKKWTARARRTRT